MSRLRITFLLVFGLLPSYPQFAGAAWQSFSVADGVPGNGVTQIFQDRAGSIWLVSPSLQISGGDERPATLNRFDGLRWTSWQIPAPSRGTPFLAEDGNGVLHCVVATTLGFTVHGRFGQGTWSFWYPSGLVRPIGSLVNGFGLGADGRLIAGFRDGIFALDPADSNAAEPLDRPTEFDQIGATVVDARGEIWLTHDFSCLGVAHRGPSGWDVVTTVDGMNVGCAPTIFAARDSSVWFGSPDGSGEVLRYREGAWSHLGTNRALANERALLFADDARGNVWCSLGDTLSRFDGTSWSNHAADDGFPRVDPYAMCGDREGNLWLGRNAVWRFDGVLPRRVLAPAGVEPFGLVAMDSTGSLWFSKFDGMVRYDRTEWRFFPTPQAPAQVYVGSPAHVTRAGQLWVGSAGGVYRFDGEQLVPPPDSVRSGMGGVNGIAEAADGTVYFTTDHGLWSFDGTRWRSYGVEHGLLGAGTRSPVVDQAGMVWFAYSGVTGKVSFFDPRLEAAIPTSVAGVRDPITALFAGPSGTMWAFTPSQLARFDGTSWTAWILRSGFKIMQPNDLAVDSTGTVFVMTNTDPTDLPSQNSVFRFDAGSWIEMSFANGQLPCFSHNLATDRQGGVWIPQCLAVHDHGRWQVQFVDAAGFGGLGPPMIEDVHGRLYLSTNGGLATFDRDRTAPQTVLLAAAPEVSPARDVTFSYLHGYAEQGPIEFSTRFDQEDWQPWSADRTWARTVPDGVHHFLVRARDSFGNVDPTPAEATFEVDTQPPVPILERPVNREVVRDTLVVVGTADDARFAGFQLDLKPATQAGWSGPGTRVVSVSPSAIVSGELGRFDSRILADGDWDLRLTVVDALGLVGTALVRITVDNEAPFADRTSPVEVTPAEGGEVFSVHGEGHVVVAPGTFLRNATVTIDVVDSASIANDLTGGSLAGPVIDLAWGAESTLKPILLDLALDHPSDTQSAIYEWTVDRRWRRVGGAIEPGSKRIRCALDPGRTGGRFGVLTGVGDDLSVVQDEVRFVPRVLRRTIPTGTVGIAFSLARPEEVSIRVFNRAGRLVRILAERRSFGSGSGVLSWDGRADSGELVADGLYLVVVESASRRRTGIVAVAD